MFPATRRRLPPDAMAVFMLILLWSLFFWRLLTPIDADRVSIVEGDFSGQFVAFGAYQYERFAAGEIPLWNPYNNGGLPFIADTQAAVFYPPRLVTIALSSLSGGWRYNALQMEMTAHILLYTLFMYALVRRMTIGRGYASVIGAFIAAVIAGYGGYISGYPPQQLALLEAGIWLPLALLGIVEATRLARFRSTWLILSGLALGLSWLAGHSQTSWFSTYLIVAYLGYRVWAQKYAWHTFAGGTALVGILSAGIAAVQLLPGIEYLGQTTRVAMTFDDKSHGFPIRDVIQFIFPGVVSLWSPLFIGVSGLVLALTALGGKERERIFWGGVTLVALGLSFGRNSAIYHAFYNVMPGLRYFRGQERAAFLIANSLAILAGIGIITLHEKRGEVVFSRRVQQGFGGLLAGCGIITGAVFVAWLGNPERYGNALGPVVLSTIVAALGLFVFTGIIHNAHRTGWLLLAALVVFELFTVNIDNTNYESTPAEEHSIMIGPPLVERVKQDTATPFRVDGGMVNSQIGIYGLGNAGSVYGVQDIRGISPLFLDGPYAIIQRDLPSEVAWELFAVKYVFTDWEVLPVDSELIARDYPNGSPLNLHRLGDPRPFALLLADYVIADTDEAARTLLADPDFDERKTVILNQAPNIELLESLPGETEAVVTDFAPERFTIRTNSAANAILSVAQVDYPGWKAAIDGRQVDTIRAYGALTAVPVEAGEHIVSFTYDPPTYKVGAGLTLVTWLGVGILGLVLPFRRKKSDASE